MCWKCAGHFPSIIYGHIFVYFVNINITLESDLVGLGFVRFSLDNRWTVLVEAKINFHVVGGWVAGLMKNKAISASSYVEAKAEISNRVATKWN